MIGYILNKIWSVGVADMWDGLCRDTVDSWLYYNHQTMAPRQPYGDGYSVRGGAENHFQQARHYFRNYPFKMSITVLLYNAGFYVIAGPLLLLGKIFDWATNEPVDLKNWVDWHPNHTFNRLGSYSKALYVFGYLPATIVSWAVTGAWYVASWSLTIALTPVLPLVQAAASLLVLFPVGLLLGLGQKIWNGMKNCFGRNRVAENQQQVLPVLVPVPAAVPEPVPAPLCKNLAVQAGVHEEKEDAEDDEDWTRCHITTVKFSTDPQSDLAPASLNPCGHTMSIAAYNGLSKKICTLDRTPITSVAPNYSLMAALEKRKLKMFPPKARDKEEKQDIQKHPLKRAASWSHRQSKRI